MTNAQEDWGEAAPADVPVVTFLRDQLAEARDQLEVAESTAAALREQERLNASLGADLKFAKGEIARLRKSIGALEKSRAKLERELADRKRLGTEQNNTLKKLRAKIRELDARTPAPNGSAPVGRLPLRLPWERSRS